MIVRVISHSRPALPGDLDLERFIVACAMVTRTSKDFREVYYEISEGKKVEMIVKLFKWRHLSPFEHVSFTFWIEGISRTCSHQLVRHRIASYSQRSQRHVKISKYVIPPEIERDEKALEIFNEALNSTMEAYNKLLEHGIRKEDARFIIPQASETAIVVTMNLRELLHFLELRLSPEAQWEIRSLAWEILKQLKEYVPNVIKVFQMEKLEGDDQRDPWRLRP